MTRSFIQEAEAGSLGQAGWLAKTSQTGKPALQNLKTDKAHWGGCGLCLHTEAQAFIPAFSLYVCVCVYPILGQWFPIPCFLSACSCKIYGTKRHLSRHAFCGLTVSQEGSRLHLPASPSALTLMLRQQRDAKSVAIITVPHVERSRNGEKCPAPPPCASNLICLCFPHS